MQELPHLYRVTANTDPDENVILKGGNTIFCDFTGTVRVRVTASCTLTFAPHIEEVYFFAGQKELKVHRVIQFLLSSFTRAGF